MDRTMRSKCVGRETHFMALVACLMFSSLASAETVTYYVVDHLGSPVAAMQSDGTLLWRESYDPYGGKRDNPSSADNDSGYTGHQFDAATDLTYMQARYYDPVVGRFMGVDPVGFIASNPMSFNRYLYVNNNPYKYNDPDGEFGLLATALLGAVAGFAVEAISQTIDVIANDASYDGSAMLRSTIVGATIGLTGGMGVAAAGAANAGRIGTVLMGAVGTVPGAATAPTVDLLIDGEMKAEGYGGEIVGAVVGSLAGGTVDDVLSGAGGVLGSKTGSTVVTNAVDAITAGEVQERVEQVEGEEK